MNLDGIRKIADAVLYEGHLLYPYRASALKNRKRWNFGVLVPEAYHQIQPDSDACLMQTECLVEGNEQTVIEVKVRFLHLLKRQVGQLLESMGALRHSPSFHYVDTLRVGERTFQSFDETMERELDVPPHTLHNLLAGMSRLTFPLSQSHEWWPLRESGGQAVGLLVREQEALTAEVDLTATRLSDGLFKVTVVIRNTTPVPTLKTTNREAVLPTSLLSTHAILAVENGAFLSLADPPEFARANAQACRHVGTWPVLVGEQGERKLLLSAPIILYDYPQIAPESPGDFFDGTEIDEMLTLRVQTLTDREKQEVRLTDEQTESVLERSDQLPAEHLWKLHGVLRALRTTEHPE